MSSNVTLIGNLTRDPTLRHAANGQAIANLGLAVNRRFQRDGEWQESTSFFDIVCWGDLGTNVAHSLGKGDRVVVTGRLEQREDQDKRKFEVVADEVGASLRWATAKPVKTASSLTPTPAMSRTSSGEEPF